MKKSAQNGVLENLTARLVKEKDLGVKALIERELTRLQKAPSSAYVAVTQDGVPVNVGDVVYQHGWNNEHKRYEVNEYHVIGISRGGKAALRPGYGECYLRGHFSGRAALHKNMVATARERVVQCAQGVIDAKNGLVSAKEALRELLAQKAPKA